ncbi:MAG: TetR/AcrR family transcriptional regulator [Spirochaetaceae bacterium]|jgi:AcrR family transcriptional regulator|nr:TetR/AcrR family transcriptional regulator [Spirochaetaceae bacterium]
MAIIIEHDKRRKRILEKALDVFVEEGFENATYQKIADRCQITRTTLYLYFRNKREIFNYSIKQLLGDVEKDILSVKGDRAQSSPDKIKKTILVILNRLEENKRLLSVILDYLISISRSPDTLQETEGGESLSDIRIRRRTIRLRHILATMVIEGIKAGQIKKIDVAAADNLLYGLIETAIFRLAILKRKSVPELTNAVELAVNSLRACCTP